MKTCRNFHNLDHVKPIPTSLCRMKYCHGDKNYPYLVGKGITTNEVLVVEEYETHSKPLTTDL